jgi:hypothetical protein
MAQSGYTPIQLYYSSTTTNVPLAANLAYGELAINITDGKLFYKDNANAIQVIGWKVVPTTAGGTGLTSYTAGDLPYYASGTALSKLGIGASTTVITSTGSAPQWTAQSALSVGTASNLKSNATTGVMQITGPAAASTRVMTIPDANYTVARTDATQTFTGTQRFTGAIMGGSSNVNFEILGTSAYSAVTVGLGIARASKISPTDDSGYIGWLFSSQTDTYSTSTQLPSDGATFADRFKVNGLSGDATLYIGNLVIGTSGKGIDFSATAGTGTSELLADYEEGTWTPTITPSTSGAVTYTTQSGTYTKVGRQVVIVFIVAGTKNTASGEFRVGGIPFNISGSAITGAINWYNPSGTALVNAVAFYFSSTLFRIGVITAANTDATAATFSSSEVSTTFSLTGTLTYFV